uniref:Uncharacterized protein n=1 Tax=Arundo donax TaxID=35708 RepID=A0A0A9GFL4_ARUDO
MFLACALLDQLHQLGEGGSAHHQPRSVYLCCCHTRIRPGLLLYSSQSSMSPLVNLSLPQSISGVHCRTINHNFVVF